MRDGSCSAGEGRSAGKSEDERQQPLHGSTPPPMVCVMRPLRGVAGLEAIGEEAGRVDENLRDVGKAVLVLDLVGQGAARDVALVDRREAHGAVVDGDGERRRRRRGAGAAAEAGDGKRERFTVELAVVGHRLDRDRSAEEFDLVVDGDRDGIALGQCPAIRHEEREGVDSHADGDSTFS